MSEMMDVLNAFGPTLKLAWVGWLAWGVGQYFWFRHERSMPAKKAASVAKAVAKKPAVPKTVAVQAAEAPVVGRLFTPTHVVREAKPSAPAMPQVQPEPVEVAVPMPVVATAEEAPVSAFDPSKAVIEQFGANQRRQRARQVRQRFRNAGCASSAAEDNPRARDAFVRCRGAASPLVLPRPYGEGRVAADRASARREDLAPRPLLIQLPTANAQLPNAQLLRSFDGSETYSSAPRCLYAGPGRLRAQHIACWAGWTFAHDYRLVPDAVPWQRGSADREIGDAAGESHLGRHSDGQFVSGRPGRSNGVDSLRQVSKPSPGPTTSMSLALIRRE